MNDFTYLDFGMSFGSNIWSFITYPAPNYTGVLNISKMDQYLSSLFTQMLGAGQTSVVLAFGQLDNIDSYFSGDFASATDTTYDVIVALLNSFEKNTVSVPGFDNFLIYLVNRAHQNGIKIVIAFGGANGTNPTFKVLQQSGETYTGQATKLANFITNYKFDGIDFDIENPTALSSQPGILDFFQSLYSQIGSEQITISLTTMLGSSWRSVFSSFLSNFSAYFNGLNLMAYSDTQYWIDPNTPAGDPNQGWTIEEWIDAVGEENAGMIHIGFDDGIPYANPSANGGQYSYNIQNGSTDGQAAAQIYLQLLEQLKEDNYPSSLGNPFFWPAATVQPNGKNRYLPTPTNGSNFISQAMQDFYNWLLSHS